MFQRLLFTCLLCSCSGQSLSSLQCHSDLSCFVFRPLCTLGYGCKPILTRINMPCSGCIELCKSMLKESAAYRCNSFVYDSARQICEIYSLTKKDCGLALYPARTYAAVLPNMACEAETTTTTSATTAAVETTTVSSAVTTTAVTTVAVSQTTKSSAATTTAAVQKADCQADQTAKYFLVQGYVLNDPNAVVLQSLTQQECLQTCKSGQKPDGSTLVCLSFDFDIDCKISSVIATDKGTGGLKKSPNAVYYEKVCQPASLVANCGDLIPRYKQFFLVGNAKDAFPSASIQECLKKCLQYRQQGTLNCNSGMFYYDDSSCVLNNETKDTMSRVFAPEPKDTVDYFQLDCGNGPTTVPTVVPTVGPTQKFTTTIGENRQPASSIATISSNVLSTQNILTVPITSPSIVTISPSQFAIVTANGPTDTAATQSPFSGQTVAIIDQREHNIMRLLSVFG